MFTITEKAAKHAKDLIQEHSSSVSNKLRLKLTIENAGCAGTKYGVQLTNVLNKRDILHKRFGIEIVIPDDFYQYFENATVDIDEAGKFKITTKDKKPEKTI
jgi:iron-sulfur cluster assembly accessory protein